MAKPAVEIETIPHDELIRNVESHVVGLHGHFRPPQLPEQHERLHPRRPTATQFGDKGLERAAGVEDVVDEENLLTGNVGQQVKSQVEFTGSGHRAAITAGPDHPHADRTFQAPNQIGHHDDTAGEHPHDRERTVPHIGLHSISQTGNPGVELFRSEQRAHDESSQYLCYRIAGPFTMQDPLPSRPQWSVIDVAGHACEVFTPSEPAPGKAVIYLHGVRERWLRESTVLRDAIEAASLPVIAPRTGRSWWLDRPMPCFDPQVTPEQYIVGSVRGEVQRRFGVVSPGIALIGASMGGQGALRIAYRHPAIFPIAAAISPAIDFHLAMREAGDRDDGEFYDTLWQTYGNVERARQDTAILHVHPLNWPRHQCFASDPSDIHWHDGATRLHSKLVALGIPHTALLDHRSGGHNSAFYDTVAPEIVQFVLTALDAESRHVPGRG